MLRFSKPEDARPIKIDHAKIKLILKNDMRYQKSVIYDLEIKPPYTKGSIDVPIEEIWSGKYIDNYPPASGIHVGFEKKRDTPMEDVEHSYKSIIEYIDRYLTGYAEDKNTCKFNFLVEVHVMAGSDKHTNAVTEILHTLKDDNCDHDKIQAYMMEAHLVMKKQLAEEYNISLTDADLCAEPEKNSKIKLF